MGHERAVAHDEASPSLPNYSLWAIFVDSHSLWWEWERAGAEHGDVVSFEVNAEKEKSYKGGPYLPHSPYSPFLRNSPRESKTRFYPSNLSEDSPELSHPCFQRVSLPPVLHVSECWWFCSGPARKMQRYSENVMCLCCLKPRWCRWIPTVQVSISETDGCQRICSSETSDKFYLPYTEVSQRRPVHDPF